MFVEVVEHFLDAGAGVQGLVAVELEVPIAPVQRPEAGGLGVVQACDREPGPLGVEIDMFGLVMGELNLIGTAAYCGEHA